MARFLFVVPPMVGHVNPTISVAAELARAGHEVAWVGYEAIFRSVLPPEATCIALDASGSEEAFRKASVRALEVRGLAALKFLWEEVLIPLAETMLPGVEAAVDAYAPDVLCVDRSAFAGAIVARKRALPWATIATTSLDRRRSIGDLHRVFEWTEQRLAELQRAVGIEPLPMVEESPHLVIVFTTLEFVGERNPDPVVYRFVGPSFRHRPATRAESFPWERLGPAPRLLVTLGSLNPQRGKQFFAAVVEALADEPLRVVAAAPHEFGPFPANFIAQPWVPQLELMPRMDAVICHAGQNTVSEALSFGLPLLVAPIKDDQPVVAGQVVGCGVGLRISFARPRPQAVREAVRRLLAEPRFREAAAGIRRSFDAAGGAPRAAELLIELLRGTGLGPTARLG